MKTEMDTVYKPNFSTKKKLQMTVALLDIGHLDWQEVKCQYKDN